MEVVARLNGEYPELLSPETSEVKLVKGATLIFLRQMEDGGWSLGGRDLGLADLYIRASEHGGGMTNTGYATVICGPNGEKLRPRHVPRGYSNDVHARFEEHELVSIYASKYGRLSPTIAVEIKRHRVEILSGIAYLRSTQVWEGQKEELPNYFGCFEAAVKAAAKKSRCYHCREPHYVDLGEK